MNFFLVALQYAVLADNVGLRIYFVSRRLCEIRFLEEEFFPSGYGVTLPNNSPYLPLVNNA